MNCDDIRELFSEYYDAEGPVDEVKAHLQDCAGCTKAFEEYTRLFDEVRALPESELPTGFHDALMRGVRMELRRKKRKAFMPFVMSAAASLLVAMLWFAGAFDFGAADYNFAPVAMPMVATDMPVATAQAVPESYMPNITEEIAAQAAAAGAVEIREMKAFDKPQTFDIDDFSLALPAPAMPPAPVMPQAAPAEAPMMDWNLDIYEVVEVDFEMLEPRISQDIEIFWGNEYGAFIEPYFGFHDGAFVGADEYISPMMFRTFEAEPMMWNDVAVAYVHESRVAIWPILLLLTAIWLTAAMFYFYRKSKT